MKFKKLETLSATLCFSLLAVLFLLQNFSTGAAIATALTVIYCFVRTIVLPGDKAQGISSWLGLYVGTFALNMIISLSLNLGLAEIITLPSSLTFDRIGWPIILIVAEIIALPVISSKSYRFGDMYFYIRYVVLAAVTIWISYIFISWDALSIVFFTVVIVALGLIIDHINTNKDASRGFVWSSIILVVFALLEGFFPQIAVNLVSYLFNFGFFGFAPMYICLIACALLTTCAIISHVMKKSSLSSSHNVRIYISMIGWIALLWVIDRVNTHFDIVFLIIAVVANLAFLLFDQNDRDIKLFSATFSAITLKYIAALALTVILPVSFYFGFFCEYLCLCIVAIGAFVFYELAAAQKIEAPHKTWAFWQFIITMAAVYSLLFFYVRNRANGKILLTVLVYVIVSIAMFALNFENKVKKANHTTMRIIICAVALLFFVIIPKAEITFKTETSNTISETTGISASEVDETEKISITLNIKDATPAKAYCYWSQDKNEVFEIDLQTGVAEIDIRYDRLNFICEDTNGTLYTSSRWFSTNKLIEPVTVAKKVN